MIKSMTQLIDRIGQGHTFSRGKGHKVADDKERWMIAETGETIDSKVAEHALSFSAIEPLQKDLLGEPMQWGNIKAMERNGRAVDGLTA